MTIDRFDSAGVVEVVVLVRDSRSSGGRVGTYRADMCCKAHGVPCADLRRFGTDMLTLRPRGNGYGKP